MSRRITVKSKEVLEVDIANEVVREMQHSTLTYDQQQQKFLNQEWDDVANNTMQKAMQLYDIKLQEYQATKIEEKCKEQGYITSRKEENGKIKIIAKQRIYA
ncbi:MAG: hypothetical protein FE834_10220 [Gammaproteobacteria bacterium]|nr:hypothetical protein [Gammaproteobacteria bacterium]